MEHQFHFSGQSLGPLTETNSFFVSPKSCFLVLFWRQKRAVLRRFDGAFGRQYRG
jgi:hypothetical protein